jgi:hypothetical protein
VRRRPRLKRRYRDDPSSAEVTLRAQARLDSAGVSCRVETGPAIAEAGLHPATGGDGNQRRPPSPRKEVMLSSAVTRGRSRGY